MTFWISSYLLETFRARFTNPVVWEPTHKW